MPIYSFKCPICGVFDRQVKVAERNRATECPICRKQANRMVAAPSLNVMPKGRRIAGLINERSGDEPRVSKGLSEHGNHRADRQLHLHDHHTSVDGAQRPWQVGH